MKKLIILYIATTLFLGANLAYCMVKVEQLTDASKAAWYELEKMPRMKIDQIKLEYELEQMRSRLDKAGVPK